MVLGVVGSSPTSHPIMIAVIDGQPVGCRNSCFPSIQNSTRSPFAGFAIQRNYGVTFRRIANHAGTSKSAAHEHQSQPCRNTEDSRAESASGSIGLRGGSYCRRASSPAAGSGQRIANMAWRSNGNLGRSIAFTEIFDYESLTKMQCPHVPAILPT